MDSLRHLLHAWFSIIGGILGWFYGAGSPALYTLIAFVCIDYISGVMNAVVSKNISSAIGAKGIFKKIMLLAFVGLGHLLDSYVIGSGQTLQTAITFFYLANEGISIIENASSLGLPIPEKLIDVLQNLKEK